MVRIAEVAQRAMLPLVPTHVGTVAAGARYLSAAEDALVGGDLYDWFHSDRRVCFIVGDVRGKGVSAVEQAARVIRAFRQSAAGAGDLATVAAEMSAYIDPFLDDEEFVTALLLQVTDRGHITLVNCGHPHPLLITSHDGAALVDLPSGLPLGLGRSFESVTVPWTPGDRLLLYTDGLSEARDARGEFLPVLPLAPLLRMSTVEDALDRVLGAVREHVPGGRFTDDLAVLLLENVDGDETHAVDPRDYRVGRITSQSIQPSPVKVGPVAPQPLEPTPVEPVPGTAAENVG
jgi:serine phosphatase RsbU (regulator of sigma subunit)